MDGKTRNIEVLLNLWKMAMAIRDWAKARELLALIRKVRAGIM